MAEKNVQAELDAIALETAQLNLEEARDRNARILAEKAEKTRRNQQRQQQLGNHRSTKKIVSSRCTHRQGGSPGNPMGGKGPSALSVANMPDGFTKLIVCNICPLRLFSPHPRNMSRKPRHLTAEARMETKAEAEARANRYQQELAAFEKLLEMSKDKLTADAAQEMDCGVTFTITNEDGIPVLPTRPCDSYA